MYRYTLLAIAVALICMVVGGCTPTNVADLGRTADDDTRAIDPAEQERLAEETAQRAADKALEASRRERQAQEYADRGPHPLIRDLAVARELVARALETDDESTLKAYIERLTNVLVALQAATPAAMIVTHLERAELHVALQQPTQEQIADATVEVMVALRISLDTQPAGIVPAVSTKIEAAKKKLDQGDAKLARDFLREAREMAATHSVSRMARSAADAVAGAQSALARDARAVVKAELEQASMMLDGIAKVALVEEEPTQTAEEVLDGEPSVAPTDDTEIDTEEPSADAAPAADAAQQPAPAAPTRSR